MKQGKRKAIVNQKECVACGCCAKECPKKAIKIEQGLYAVIQFDLCVGCGKCKVACPACVIEICNIEEESI